ncbi:hypothetical protein DFA_10749 [Cavenderia fasciculata]|uniref:Transmembrane protein n=1 Tax=Cavenderia fasciculata TaxID=261658 RepID=F4QBA4_CACFS|nr:uncharacterized protein DFA_10749 [Cavenderia fasciculata]EGG14876.1 hypothetical protein DFA_10749 [Cavenderia fasciculata]|eukprot:XP_004351392.1 hypothetical protein DFA_10749 [Cavenderia fasciculata]
MIRVANIVIFTMFACSWVLLIISFGTYWYKEVIYGLSDDDKTIYFTSYKDIKVITKHNEYTSDIQSPSKHQKEILRSSFALAITTWLTVSLLLTFIIFSFLGVLHKSPIPLARLTKYILAPIAFTMGFTSIFVFVHLGVAKHRDCLTVYGHNETSCQDEEMEQKFIFNHIRNGTSDDTSYRVTGDPYIGWITLVMSTCFIFIGGIISIFLANYNDSNNINNNKNKNNNNKNQSSSSSFTQATVSKLQRCCESGNVNSSNWTTFYCQMLLLSTSTIIQSIHPSVHP